MLASLSTHVTSAIGDHGVYAVFLLMAVDAVFPAASELVMVYAGALAAGAFASQHVDLFGTRIDDHATAYVVVALAGTLGYLAGAIVGWWIGRYGGRPFLERRGRWLHLSRERLDRAGRWFDRWDDWAVLVGRITPVARSFVSIPAGVFRTPFGRYVVLTLIGSALWAFAFAAIGWGVGASYHRFDKGFEVLEAALVAGLLLLAVYVFVRRRRSSTMA